VKDGTWEPGQAEDEAMHLANDSLVLFPITEETLAMGSLAETGFSSAEKWNGNRFIVIYVAPDVTPELHADNKAAASGSKRARQLVREHLKKVTNPNVFVVESMDELLHTSLKLWGALQLMQAARNPQANAWEAPLRSPMWEELPSSESLETA
jgi:hypothetical protein